MNRKEPLGLPRGSVRAILTILLLVLLAVTMFVSVVPGAEDIRTGLVALATLAIKSYFDVRKEQNDVDGPPLEPPATFED